MPFSLSLADNHPRDGVSRGSCPVRRLWGKKQNSGYLGYEEAARKPFVLSAASRCVSKRSPTRAKYVLKINQNYGNGAARQNRMCCHRSKRHRQCGQVLRQRAWNTFQSYDAECSEGRNRVQECLVSIFR